MRKRLLYPLAFLILLGGATWLLRQQIFTALAEYLVRVDPIEKAPVAVVLGGDPTGGRILTACSLLREGYIDKIWISGVLAMYGQTEAQLTAAYAKRNGCDESRFVLLQNEVDSTADEARLVTAAMRREGIAKYILLTTNFHTRRSGEKFRRAAPDLKAIVIAARDREFDPQAWWKSRKQQKTFAYEWLKTVTGWVGL
jgi:uncharacterized SAM-binding protein YcdF (DUF218 family)